MQDLIRDNRYLCSHCGQKIEWKPKPYAWFDYCMIGALFVGLGMGLDSLLEKIERGRIYEYRNVQILQKYDDSHFLLAKPDGPFHAWFCGDYRVDLVVGCSLERLRYEDKGRCWSVAAPDL